MDKRLLKIFSGSSHPELAAEIAASLGEKLSEMQISRFACGEIYAKPVETVRGADVFIIQTASANVNEDLMELFIMIDALKRSFAREIHVVMPHFGYARQDRVATRREPISAKLIADLISTAGADHLIAMKFHSDQIQGFFNFPVDNLDANNLLANYFLEKKIPDLVVVSPDVGGAKDAKKFADTLGAELAIIHKNRPKHNHAEVTHVVGDVAGKNCVVFDDMIDTGGSVAAAYNALVKMGAVGDIYLAATHPVFSDPVAERLGAVGYKEIIVTNTLPILKKNMLPNLKVISVAPLLGRIIRHVYEGKSVTTVYNS